MMCVYLDSVQRRASFKVFPGGSKVQEDNEEEEGGGARMQ